MLSVEKGTKCFCWYSIPLVVWEMKVLDKQPLWTQELGKETYRGKERRPKEDRKGQISFCCKMVDPHGHVCGWSSHKYYTWDWIEEYLKCVSVFWDCLQSLIELAEGNVVDWYGCHYVWKLKWMELLITWQKHVLHIHSQDLPQPAVSKKGPLSGPSGTAWTENARNVICPRLLGGGGVGNMRKASFTSLLLKGLFELNSIWTLTPK